MNEPNEAEILDENSLTKFEDDWPLFEKFLGYLRYLQIKPYIMSTPKPICVDIGCGFYGRFLKSISHLIKRGYGFDIRGNDEKYANICIVNNSKCLGRIPLKDNRVDRVFMLAVLEHLPLNDRLIEEGVRVLKPGGLLILTTPTPLAKPVLEFLSYKLHLISEASIREHKHYYNRQELGYRVIKSGCAVLAYQTFQLGFNQLIVGIKQG